MSDKIRFSKTAGFYRVTFSAALSIALAPDAGAQTQLRVHGYIQADTRASDTTSTILLRRVRPIFDATIDDDITLRISPDFAQGTVKLFDAYADIRLASALKLRAGKFKPPIGLERLQSATDLHFVERGLPTNLVPTRDVGVQLHGTASRVAYQVGVFNGVPDLGNGDGDATNSKDIAARVLFHPSRTHNTAIGLAASTGRETGSQLPTYLTPAQQTFFRYRSDVTADGRRTRLAPQANLNVGPFGLLAEYTRSSQRVRRASALATVYATAWQTEAFWRFTRTLEATTRIGALAIAAAPTFADSTSTSRRITAGAIGLNWHLAPSVKVVANYERSTFDNRAPENFIVSRIQTAF